ncbi:MAG: hypothetical protein KDB23_13665, partial [Planctomycetales bacterium]|nr:hypothetical protein [Planctomycetales bacterium]
MSETLIPPSFLFRLAVPCRHYSGTWAPTGVELDERYIMTSFHAELNQGPRFAELRLGWNAKGIYVNLRTTGKQQTPWCRDTRIDDSDGLTLLLDTRNVPDIHRAGRFCHRYVFLPQGAGRLLNDPV